MLDNKIPLRTCVVTHNKFPKNSLLRIVLLATGEIIVDPGGKINGHGVYLKKDQATFALAMKSHALERALKKPVPEEVYKKIQFYLDD